MLALLGAAVVSWRVYAHRQKRRARIALLTEGVDVLALWTYTPEEWRRAREDEFTWASSKDNRDYGGRVYISPTTIYLQGEHRDRLIDLEGDGRVVTHASYRGANESPLKLRVRWKTITRRRDGPDEIHYHKEDYRIPVPPSAKEAAQKVVEYFTARMGENPDAHVSLVGDDEVISVFGNDAF